MNLSCPVCNVHGMNVIREEPAAGSRILYCGMCQIGVTVPTPSQGELASRYSFGTYRAASGKRFTRLVEAAIVLARRFRRKRIEKIVSKGRILDVGCGRGVFLAIMKKHGWTVTGTEYDRETADAIEKTYDIPIVTGNPGDWDFPPGSFDVVIMNHVLEHLPSPADAIRECSRVLVEGGFLIVAVPNIASLQSSLGKELWFHLDIRYHLYHFSEEGLSGLLEKHGFRPIKTRQFNMEYNLFGWLQTLLNMTGIRKNFLYDLLKKKNLRDPRISGDSERDLIATIFLVPLYFPLALFLSLFESLILKRGGTVEMYAVKI